MGSLTREQINEMKFFHVGENVRISDKASFHGCENIIIGDNVRIDDFCLISAGKGGIKIGKHIHIAAYSSLIGNEIIFLDDYSNISSRVSIYSSSDDYSGDFMSNPTIPTAFTNVDSRPVLVGKHVIIGCGSVVLPGVILKEGVAIGALSFVNSDCQAFGIYAGSPARWIKKRHTRISDLEREFCNS